MKENKSYYYNDYYMSKDSDNPTFYLATTPIKGSVKVRNNGIKLCDNEFTVEKNYISQISETVFFHKKAKKKISKIDFENSRDFYSIAIPKAKKIIGVWVNNSLIQKDNYKLFKGVLTLTGYDFFSKDVILVQYSSKYAVNHKLCLKEKSYKGDIISIDYAY